MAGAEFEREGGHLFEVGDALAVEGVVELFGAVGRHVGAESFAEIVLVHPEEASHPSRVARGRGRRRESEQF